MKEKKKRSKNREEEKQKDVAEDRSSSFPQPNADPQLQPDTDEIYFATEPNDPLSDDNDHSNIG